MLTRTLGNARRPFLVRVMCACAAAWTAMAGVSQVSAKEPARGESEPGNGAPLSRADEVFFEAKIRPILVQRCYECHSTESGESSGELRLDSAIALRRGGIRGAAVVPGDAKNSLLIQAVSYVDPDMEMPPTGKLPEAEIQLLRQWVVRGAPDPRPETGEVHSEAVAVTRKSPATHWAFQQPRLSVGPKGTWPRAKDLIDAVADRVAAGRELVRAELADDQTLVRRLYFDLTGLAPTIDQIQRFVSDPHPGKYDRLVDQLLASPEFGERFGRYWLDVARYADTLGYATAGKERRIQGSQRYRDWVVRAFAGDVPYDQMIRLQLAADRIDPENESGDLDAMGFLTTGRRFLNPHDTIDDRIDVVTRGLLGLTVTCARCHDHKFDPIPTVDYYSLYGVFSSSHHNPDGASPLMMEDKAKPRDVRVFLRGQPGQRGELAPRRYLTSLRATDEPSFQVGSGREELADRIADPVNPLTWRVMVNRVWAHLIGQPLVDTTSDFGFRTEPPVAPEILDDLAADFAGHRSVKRLVRRIVGSHTYRQLAQATAKVRDADPDNLYLTRSNRRRRDFESLRDTMLQVTQHLDRQIGGVPVEITLSSPMPRRTLYAMIDRQNLPPLFRTFDFASPDTHSPKRYFTTVPQQALYLFNNMQVLELSRALARQARSAASDDTRRLIGELFQRSLSRLPTDDELAGAANFLAKPLQLTDLGRDPRSLWSYGLLRRVDNQWTQWEPLSVFANARWQPSESFPADSPHGHAFVGSEMGHSPNDSSLAIVRRWTAPLSGRVSIQGMIGHRARQGDGVVADFRIAGKSVFQGIQKSNNRPYGPITRRVSRGDHIDFAVSAGKSPNYDSFFLRTKVQLTADSGEIVDSDSVADFSGPIDYAGTKPLDRVEQLAQVLLMSN
ncbi:MAG: PSD1 and planctomycete cytochrome C domain-containing protein, partial [Planctomycetota bacterium]